MSSWAARAQRAWARPAAHAAVWYLLSRLLFLAIAAVDVLVHHGTLGQELRHWDGIWYLRVAEHGYPHTVDSAYEHYSTLGFLPLYPLLIWALWHLAGIGALGAGLAISLGFGLLATLLVERLARGWWGAALARRTVIFWCLWPGTIVFSMVYSEALSVTLIAATLLALRSRRWLLAGCCSALASATAPIAVALVPAVAFCAYRQLKSGSSSSGESRRAIAGTLISPLGLVAFAGFLWSWTGTPLASVRVQRGAWANRSNPLALPDRIGSTIGQIFGIGNPAHGPGGIDLYNVAAAICTVILIYGLVLLWRQRQRLGPAATVYTAFAALLLCTSENAPPDPRMLLSAFPALLAFGVRFSGRHYRWLLGLTLLATVVISYLTFVGSWMLP